MIISIATIILNAQCIESKTVIRLGTAAPKNSEWHQILKEFAAGVQSVTDGEVRVRIYAGGIVGSEQDMVRKMRIKQLQAAAVSASGLSDIDKSVYALMIPLMFESYEEWDYVRGKLNEDLTGKLKEKGFVVLTWSDVGWVHFFSKEPLKTPEQLKKMKLAASATEASSVEIMKWAGFKPVPITYADVVTGLQTGLIEAIYMPVIYAESSNIFRYAPNMTDLKWAPLQGAIVIHGETWEEVKPEYRRKIMDVADEMGRKLMEDTRNREKASLEAMTKRGLKIWELSEQEKRQWVETAKEAYDKIKGNLVPAGMFDKVLRLRDEYRAP